MTTLDRPGTVPQPVRATIAAVTSAVSDVLDSTPAPARRDAVDVIQQSRLGRIGVDHGPQAAAAAVRALAAVDAGLADLLLEHYLVVDRLRSVGAVAAVGDAGRGHLLGLATPVATLDERPAATGARIRGAALTAAPPGHLDLLVVPVELGPGPALAVLPVHRAGVTPLPERVHGRHLLLLDDTALLGPEIVPLPDRSPPEAPDDRHPRHHPLVLAALLGALDRAATRHPAAVRERERLSPIAATTWTPT